MALGQNAEFEGSAFTQENGESLVCGRATSTRATKRIPKESNHKRPNRNLVALNIGTNFPAAPGPSAF